MQDPMNELIGHPIETIGFGDGYVTIVIGEGYALRISNQVNIRLSEGVVESSVITSIQYSNDMIRIIVGDNGAIDILYRDENFRSPEAFTIKTPSGFFVDRGRE